MEEDKALPWGATLGPLRKLTQEPGRHALQKSLPLSHQHSAEACMVAEGRECSSRNTNRACSLHCELACGPRIKKIPTCLSAPLGGWLRTESCQRPRTTRSAASQASDACLSSCECAIWWNTDFGNASSQIHPALTVHELSQQQPRNSFLKRSGDDHLYSRAVTRMR